MLREKGEAENKGVTGLCVPCWFVTVKLKVY